MVNQEIEFKMSSLANIQFKYNMIESGDVIQKKLGVLCEALGIELGPPELKSIQDDYYDDAKNSLKQAGISFRYRRRVDKDNVVTLKIEDSKNEQKDVIVRKEDEFVCTDEDFKLLLLKSNLENRILSNFKVGIHIGILEHLISIHNERTSFKINTDVAKYEICFDKYHYCNPILNTYSEYFGEVEIELEGSSQLPTDAKLTKLRTLLTELFCYRPNSDTKLERGIEWKHHPTKVTKVYTLAFDIVGFSQSGSDKQKNDILKLNHFARLAVKENRGDENVIYLPTGDGMLMVFEDRPDTLLPIVMSMHSQLRDYLQIWSATNGTFSFRTGIHCGEAFKYSDVNENLNYAGGGINMAVRVMDQCKAWQVFASIEAYRAIGEAIAMFGKYFHPIGKVTVKHGAEIDIYNVYEEKNFGMR